MASNELPAWRFVFSQEAEIEELPGKTHFWYCKPGLIRDTNLMFVRAKLPPGEAHSFHYHPHMEEILYILSGEATQYVEREGKGMRSGDSIYLPAGLVHATYNLSTQPLEFIAVLAPAKNQGPVTVEVRKEEPWNELDEQIRRGIGTSSH